MDRRSPSEVSRLRATLATLDREIARLPAPDRPSDLLGSWYSLVDQLDLGPMPDLRECPACGRTVMRAARLCGYCWTKLVPVAKST